MCERRNEEERGGDKLALLLVLHAVRWELLLWTVLRGVLMLLRSVPRDRLEKGFQPCA